MQELELGSRNYHYVLVVLHLFGDPLFVDADTHTVTVSVPKNLKERLMIVINIPEILLKTHDCVHNIWAIPQTHISTMHNRSTNLETTEVQSTHALCT